MRLDSRVLARLLRRLRSSIGAINVKDPRKTSVEMLKGLVRAACLTAVVTPAVASNPWIESHVAASYGYVLGKGEAAGRSLAASSSKGDPKAKPTSKPSSAGSSPRDGLTRN
jgi:hypothetical protein